ncbi:MAG: alpha-1,6-mannosyltransferase [Marivirga sp.]|jgi:alpha-1,6-mannosyltransferase
MRSRQHQIVLVLFGLVLVTISYFTERSQSPVLLSQFSALFIGYLWLYRYANEINDADIFKSAVAFRVLLICAIPNLSEDVYRFIWDGHLWLNNIDAYQYLPSIVVEQMPTIVSSTLYNKLNSPNYFTIYPPLNQLLFLGAALFKHTYLSIVFIKLFIVAAEVLSLVGLRKLLLNQVNSTKVFVIYAFNPLVILEMSGNLHFEAFVVCALIWTVVFFKQNKYLKSGLMMGLAIGFKILPIILLASFFRKLKLSQYVLWVSVAIGSAFISFLPLVQTHIFSGIQESAQLYFQSFEFNASLYYFARYIGYQIYGYNIIQTAGPYIALTGIFLIVLYNVFIARNILIWERMLFSWLIYCLFATTIHPWYIIPLLLFGAMSGYGFPILWSFLIFFTYLGYSTTGFTENLWITTFEYILVLAYAVFEISIKYIRNHDETINAS